MTLAESSSAAREATLVQALDHDVTRYVERTRARCDRVASRRDEMVARLQREVSKLWPQADCAMYGSLAVGLANERSDVDLVVQHIPSRPEFSGHEHQAACAKRLAQQLGDVFWVRSIKTIDRSVTPIIALVTRSTANDEERIRDKLQAVRSTASPPSSIPRAGRTAAPALPLAPTPPRADFELSLDVSFDAPGHHGVEAVRLMNEQCGVMPLLRPLVLVIKAVLEQRALKRAYSGGLSSYAVLIMAVRFLRDWHHHTHEPDGAPGALGRVVLGFLRFFGQQFSPERQGITLRERERFSADGGGGYLRRDHPTLTMFRCDSLLVIDPINPANNVCKHCYRINEVQRTLAEALTALEAAALVGPAASAAAGRTTEWRVLHAVLKLDD